MTVSAMSIGPHIHKSLSFVPSKDFTPITNIVNTPGAVLAGIKTPYNSLQDMVKAAKAQPGKINYASVGLGSLPHLIAEKLAFDAGISLAHIPYKGAAPAMQDLLAGVVELSFESSLTNTVANYNSGRLKVLATTGSKRVPILGNIPTVAESGFPGFAIENWQGLFAPTGTPLSVIAQIAEHVAAISADKTFADQLTAQGAVPDFLSPGDFSIFVKGESQKFGKLVKDSGAKGD
jgi:tripartite-type tricarboxylate transporter receptor subunit TctC